MDKNVINDTYAFADGTMVRRDNDLTKLYNRAYGKICRMKGSGDNRAMQKLANKAWGKYGNYVKDGIRKEARWPAGRGIAVGHEDLATHKLYTKDNSMCHIPKPVLERRGCPPCPAFVFAEDGRITVHAWDRKGKRSS